MAKRSSPDDRDPARGLTRRGLFRSIGTAAVVAGCVQQDDSSTKDPDTATSSIGAEGAFGLEPAPLEFVLDGQPVRAEVDARTTLLAMLRLELDQTGTKLVCDRGACGACMVLVDGAPRNSCMLLAHDVAGREVRTVAGLAKGETLSALQAAFVAHDALQCGFCTSGMLISSTALLERSGGTQGLTRDEVESAIAGNLCRCGTYPHVVDAVMSVATGGPGRKPEAELIQVRKERS